MLAFWNASIVEIAWTLLGLVGGTIAWGNVRFSRRDIEALRVMNDRTIEMHRAMMIIAYGHYRNDLFRLCKHCVIFFIGLAAMATPPQLRSQPVSTVGVIITAGLFTISILLVLASTLDRRQREAMEDL